MLLPSFYDMAIGLIRTRDRGLGDGNRDVGVGAGRVTSHFDLAPHTVFSGCRFPVAVYLIRDLGDSEALVRPFRLQG